MPEIRRSTLLIASAVFLTVFTNRTLFEEVAAVYPPASGHQGFLLALGVVALGANLLLLALTC